MLFRACCTNPRCQRYVEVEGAHLGKESACPACQQSFRPSAPFGPAELNRTIRYHILERIGGGGMGEVYRARDYRLDREVALKIPLGTGKPSRDLLERFQIEVEAVRRLDHENLCKLIDHGVDHVPPFLTMEFLQGGSLEARVRAYRDASIGEVLALVRTLAMGLEHAHRHGVVHRDIKPTNVLFGADGRPRIADFGLALLTDRPLEARLTEVHQVLGSLLYMSPEQFDGARAAIDRSTDIYSLGVVMFRLLTGEFPYRTELEDQNRGAIIAEIRDGLTRVPSHLREGLDSRIDAAFRKATAPRPSDRYHSMLAMADELGEMLGVPATDCLRSRQIHGTAAADLSPTVALPPGADVLILSRIPAGSFLMGSDTDAFGDEGPVRRVTITHDFLLGVYPVTQAQYRRLMGNAARPYFDGRPTAPMESVNWLDAVHFCNALSEVEDLPAYYRIDGENVTPDGGPGYRLPTEAEWEYACRAGTLTAYNFGDDPALLANHAWFQDNSGESVQPVGHWPAHAWGLHDMHGNVWEWCWDWYGPYDPSACIDPTGPARGTARVLRGGSWHHPAASLRSAARVSWEPNETQMLTWWFGFRVARNA